MTSHQAVFFLFDLTLILGMACVCGVLSRRLGQPAVIGEVLAGIVLGPTLFGSAISGTLFPADGLPFLTALANAGIAIFMFTVGLELDHSMLRGTGRVAGIVSVGSILLPFGLGVILAVQLLTHHHAGNPLGFALFIGAAMSITAFPVLARILADRTMQTTRIGSLALVCAAVDDLLGWSLLALVVAVAGDHASSPWLIALVVPYLVLMLAVVRPLLVRLAQKRTAVGRLPVDLLAATLGGMLLSGAVTEWMGLHFIFGSFLFGVIMPRRGTQKLREEVAGSIAKLNAVLLLPVFFLVAGLKVDLSHVTLADLGDLGLILVAAVGGKGLGAFLGARLSGVGTRASAAIAVLMNTRGLTELVILNVGLQLAVIDSGLYSLMMVMAVVTTAMTGPLLQLLYPQRLIDRERLGCIHLPPGQKSEEPVPDAA